MKKKLFLSITFILLIAFSISVYSIYFAPTLKTPHNQNQYRTELDAENKKILAEKTYSNFAFGIQYTTSIIFNDGTIYTWDYSAQTYDFPFATEATSSKEYYINYILNNGKKSSKKVSTTDLETMENYIENLEDSIKIQYPGADQGTSSTSVWNSNGTEIKLRLSGDSVGKNKELNTKKILKIIDSYI